MYSYTNNVHFNSFVLLKHDDLMRREFTRIVKYMTHLPDSFYVYNCAIYCVMDNYVAKCKPSIIKKNIIKALNSYVTLFMAVQTSEFGVRKM